MEDTLLKGESNNIEYKVEIPADKKKLKNCCCFSEWDFRVNMFCIGTTQTTQTTQTVQLEEEIIEKSMIQMIERYQ